MIVETKVNGRPALATYMNEKFEPVDDETLASVVEVMFTDEQNGTIFLVPKAHTTVGTSAPEPQAEAKSHRLVRPWHRTKRERWIALRAYARDALATKFDPNEPRDDSGKWTDGGGSDTEAADRPTGAKAPGAPERVSTSVPSAKKQGFDPHQRQDLSPSYATFKQAMQSPKYAEGVGKLMDRYGGSFLRLPKDATQEQKAEAFVEHAKANITALYDAQKSELRGRSGTWYRGANKIAHDFAKEYNVSPRAVAGVMASLSPQRDWDQNVELAKRVLDIAVKNKDVPIAGEAAAKTKSAMLTYAQRQTEEADDLEAKNTGTQGDKTKIENRRDAAKILNDLATTFEGKTLSQIPNVAEQAMLLRFYDEGNAAPGRAYPIWNPEGTPSGDIARNKGKGGKEGSPKQVGWGSFAMTANGLSILADDNRANISAQLGDNHKVRNFYNNIISPDHGQDTTIDTHAVAAAALMPLGGNDELVKEGLGMAGPKNADTGLKGIYALYFEAYRRAAEEKGVLPRQMQSITWEAVRGLFSPEEKRDVKLEASVNATWKQYQEGKIDRAQAQREILDRGIKPPRWAKSYLGADAGEGLRAARG